MAIVRPTLRGALESESSTDLYDLRIRVEGPELPTERFDVTVHDHEPDSIEIDTANYVNSSQLLKVFGTSDFTSG